MKRLCSLSLILICGCMSAGLYAQSDRIDASEDSDYFFPDEGSESMLSDSLIDDIEKLFHPVDTLQVVQDKLEKTSNAIFNFQGKTFKPVDSLSLLSDSSDLKKAKDYLSKPPEVLREVDSINNSFQSSLDSLTNFKKADSVAQRISSWQDMSAKSFDTLTIIPESSFDIKLNEVSPASSEVIQEKISGLSLPNKDVTTEAADKSQEVISLEALEKIDPPKQVKEIETLDKEIRDLSNQSETFGEINERIGDKPQVDLDSLTTEKAIEKVADGVEEKAEEKLAEQLNGLESDQTFFDPSKAGHLSSKSKYFQKKENVYKEITERAKALGLDGMKGVEDRVAASQEKLSKYKKKYSDVENIKDLDEKPANPMQGKPLKERVIWGGNFQVHRKRPFGIDISPQVSYKLTRLLSLGVGGTYRLIINDEGDGINNGEQVYGGRTFLDYEIFKGFAAHVEYEKMRLMVPINFTDKDTQRDWINSGLVGIKKRYSVSRKIIGNAQILYNLFPDKKDQRSDRVIFRFGFELAPGTKKKSPKNDDQ